MNIPILTVRDADGNIIKIPAIKGDKGDRGIQGEKGDSYILTDADKQQIANVVGSAFGINVLDGFLGDISGLPLGTFVVGENLADVLYDNPMAQQEIVFQKGDLIIVQQTPDEEQPDVFNNKVHFFGSNGIGSVVPYRDPEYSQLYYKCVPMSTNYSNGDEVAY